MSKDIYFGEGAKFENFPVIEKNENDEISLNNISSFCSFLSNVYKLAPPLLSNNLNDIESRKKNNELDLNNFSRHNTECQTPSKVAANSNKIKIPPHFQIENVNQSLELEENQLQQYDDFLKLNNIKEKKVYSGKKRKRNEKHEEKEENEEKKKRDTKNCGRRKKDDTNIRKHNKNSHDNIVKKIKSNFLIHLIIFLNLIKDIFQTNGEKEGNESIIFKKLHYEKLMSKTSIEDNLNFLNQPLSEICSNNISHKYACELDWNKNIIEKIKKEEHHHILISILDMNFENWIDIMLGKKELEEIIKFKKEDENIINDIKKAFIEVKKKFKNKILNKNNDNKFCSEYFYYAYNYKRYFLLKASRYKNKI